MRGRHVELQLDAPHALEDPLGHHALTVEQVPDDSERVRRIELQLDVPPSHYEPGARPTGQQATTGARAGQKTEEREALKL